MCQKMAKSCGGERGMEANCPRGQSSTRAVSKRSSFLGSLIRNCGKIKLTYPRIGGGGGVHRDFLTSTSHLRQ